MPTNKSFAVVCYQLDYVYRINQQRSLYCGQFWEGHYMSKRQGVSLRIAVSEVLLMILLSDLLSIPKRGLLIVIW